MWSKGVPDRVTGGIHFWTVGPFMQEFLSPSGAMSWWETNRVPDSSRKKNGRFSNIVALTYQSFEQKPT